MVLNQALLRMILSEEDGWRLDVGMAHLAFG